MNLAPDLMVRKLFEEGFDQRRLGVCDELFAVEYREHAIAPFGTEAPGVVEGHTHMRGVITWLVSQFSDLRMTVQSVAAATDTVAVLVRSTGTNDGPLNGVIPPTGRAFESLQSHWYRVEGGRFAEHWATRDDLTMLSQLGLLAPPTPDR